MSNKTGRPPVPRDLIKRQKSVYLDDVEIGKLKAIAREMDTTGSGVLRRLIKQYKLKNID